MDQKSWLWKKRSTEKTLVADKATSSFSKNEEEVTEVQKLLTEKTDLERDLRISNEKLSSALSECNAKDNIAKKQVKIAEEAIAGWEKAETEAISLKQELDKVLQQKAASEERIGHLDAALRECMQQSRVIREEHEKRVHGALTKTSEEFKKIRIALDEKLVEAGKRIAKVDAENTQLTKALSGKDKLIEDLGKYQTQLEAELKALLLRVESTEKENASLKYEVCVLEKELDIRNEEREFNRRMADVAQKQQQDSAEKITKLEMECQQLRLLVRKRLPGPAALAKMKSEVVTLNNGQVETRRRKSNPSPTTSMEFCTELAPDGSGERVNLLTEQLYAMVEENKALRHALNKKSSELQFSRNMYARTASRLSRADGQVEELLEVQAPAEPGKYFSQEHSLAASSDVGSDDKASCAESWASALILELEHFKNEKQLRTLSHRNMGTSDMNLMDDFAEMEKLAVVSVDFPAGSSQHSSEEGNAIIGSSGSPFGGHSSSEPGRGSGPVYDCPSEPFVSGQKIQSGYIAVNGVAGWLDDMLKMLLEHSHTSQRNPCELLEDMKVALAHNRGKGSGNHLDALCDGSGHVIQTSSNKSLDLDASDTRTGNSIANTEKSGQKFGSNANISIHKVLELLEGINIQSKDNVVAEFSSGKDDKTISYKNSENPTGYTVRMFQWKTAELSAILQQFVRTCNELLKGTADLEEFVQQVASSLEWIINHCFSLQDVSSMKDAIRNHLDWDESRSESEVDSESADHPPRREEGKIWNVEWADEESPILDLEGRPQSEIFKGECVMIELQESKGIIDNLHAEMETMEQSKEKFANQIEKQKMIKEDLETQLMETNHEWGKACERISHLESELEDKNNTCKRLEETCHDLKIQLQSMSSKDVLDKGEHQEKQLQSDWEITAASEKLAECQETILNLGKQLKALASPSDAALFDKVMSTTADSVVTSLSTPTKNISRRSSLLNKMRAEDNDPHGASTNTKEENQNGDGYSAVGTNAATEYSGKSANSDGINHEEKSRTAVASMDIVPCKKNGGRSFFGKLFWRRKKGKEPCP